LRQQGEPSRLDWAEIVRAVTIDLSPLIADHELDFDIETDPAPVLAHEWALRELTRNLLHNAIKHTPDHGRLAVALVATANQATLTIADAGRGLTDEQRQRLFQPFAAGEASRRDAQGSVGLGLAICHEIVQSLHGRITLENRLGAAGAVVGLDACVTLPLADNAA